MDTRLETGTLGEIVAANDRAAAIFEKHGLDFCCRGRDSVIEACREKGVDPRRVLDELEELALLTGGVGASVANWPPDQLIDHIAAVHHGYVRRTLPIVAGYLSALVAAHGARHPELVGIQTHFTALTQDLELHMRKEEEVLFPYIKAMVESERDHRPYPSDIFGTVQHPIRMFEGEHQEAGDRMAAIRALAHGYVVPEDGCATYRMCYAELQAFEHDLHVHVHLENSVLFPGAVALEQRLLHDLE